MPSDRYPLANLRGIALFMRILAADDLWRKATPRQRHIIHEKADPIIAEIKAAAEQGDESGSWERPWVDARPGTQDSMWRKGLVDDEYRLTAAAIEAAMFKGGDR